MASETSPPTSFSARRRWGIFFSVVVSIAAVGALVVMVNYLGARYYTRLMWSSESNTQLSPQTLSLLKHITNEVKVTVYYDRQDNLYPSVIALLDEYRLTNPKISVQTVDYLVDAGAAQKVKDLYKLGSSEAKNLVIFDCEGRLKIIQAMQLADYGYEEVANNKEAEYERHLKGFSGEKWFSAALLSVISSRPFMACFLEGHGEHSLGDKGGNGYQKFGQVLEENNVLTRSIHLNDTNEIPADCNLLIIAGPGNAIPHEELEKIKQYLNQGGRMFVLFDYRTRNIATGLEMLLADWNVSVGMNVAQDPENKQSGEAALEVSHFNHNHPLVEPLIGTSLVMVYPRSVRVLSMSKAGPDTPQVVELAFTGNSGTTSDDPQPGPIPLLAAVEKGSIKGVFTERGTTAILVAGDSEFLCNQIIEAGDNREFAGLAANWLLDQTQLLQGVGPHEVKGYKLRMTQGQLKRVSWLFLGAMPGAILLFGGLVWIRRRR